MKEQQRESHRNHEQQQETVRPAPQAPGTTRIPAQQVLTLLRQGDSLRELPEPLLGELAQAVGNGCLTELLRQSGGGECGTYMLAEWPPNLWEDEVNHIRTAPPALFSPPDWPEGGWEQSPNRPGGIRDRGESLRHS